MAKQLWFDRIGATTHRANNDAKLNAAASWWSPHLLSEVRGSSPRGLSATSVLGPTNGIEVVNNLAANLPAEWISSPLSADFTISGTITLNLWASEVTMNDNVAINAIIEKMDGATGVLTQIAKTARVTEAALTTSAVNNFTVAPTPTAIKRGDRLRVRVFADDAGTMAAGGSMTFNFAGSTAGADFDSWIQFTENLTFEPLTTPTGSTYYLTNAATSGLNEIFQQLASTSDYSLGAGGGQERWAQSFVATGPLKKVSCWLGRSATPPVDNVALEIWTDNGAGSPLALLHTIDNSIVGSALSTTAAQFVYDNLSNSLTAGVTYWFVVSRTGSANVNCPTIRGSTATVPWGAFKNGNAAGSSWSVSSVKSLTCEIQTTISQKVASQTRGSGSVNAVTNTAAGPTAGIRITASAGGTVIEWYTPPLDAVTFGGVAKFNVRALESNVAANASLKAEIAITNGDGSGAVVWGTGNRLGSETTSEIGTTDFSHTIWVSGDDTALADGQRLRFRIYVEDDCVAPLATGFTVTVSYSGATAAVAGDTYVILPQTVTEAGPKTRYGATSLAMTFGAAITANAWQVPKLHTFKDRFDPIANFISNGNFETDASGWTADSTLIFERPITRTTAEKHSGAASGQVTTLAANEGIATSFPCIAGKWYEATCWVKTSTDGVQMEAFFSNADGSNYGGTAPIVTTAWMKQINRWFCNATGTAHYFWRTSTGGATFFIDDVVIHEEGVGELDIGPFAGWNQSNLPIPTNLLTNGGFENGDASWWGKGACWQHDIVTSPVRSGTYALKTTRLDAAEDTNACFQGIALPAAGEYWASVWVNLPASWGSNQMVFSISGRSAGPDAEPNYSIRDRWQELRIKFYQNSATTVYPFFYTPGARVGDYFYIDNCIVGALAAGGPVWDSSGQRAELPIVGSGSSTMTTLWSSKAKWWEPQNVFDLRDSFLSARATVPPNPSGLNPSLDMYVITAEGKANMLNLGAPNFEGKLYAYQRVDSAWYEVNSAGWPIYNPVTHAWWRIRETAGMISFETSPDGATWTEIAVTGTPFNVARVVPSFETYQNTGTGMSYGSAYVDDVNIEVQAVPVGKKVSATTVRGITFLLPPQTIVIGRRVSATLVKGVTLVPGPVTVIVGKKTVATTVRGVTLAATGTVSLVVGKKISATAVRGVTLAPQPVTVIIGRKATATTVRGVTLAATGAAAVVVGQKISTTTVRGVTLAAVGTANVVIGRESGATVVRGVTLVAGAANVVIGKEAVPTTVRGVTVSATGAATIVIGTEAVPTVVRGVALSAGGTATVVIGTEAVPTVVRGISIISLNQNFPVTLAASMTLVPTMARSASDFRTLAVTATLTPALARVLKSLRTVAATTTLTPVMSRQAFFYRAVPATVTFVPTLARKLVAPRTIAASVTLTPTMTRLQSGARTLAATVTLVPSMARNFKAYRTFAVTVTIAPTLVKVSSFFRAPSVTVTLTPAMARKLSAYRLISPTLTLTPVMTRKLFASRAISAVVSFVADFSWSSGNAVNFPVTVTITPTMAKAMKLTKPMVATVTLIPAMQRKITKPVALVMTLTPVLSRLLSAYRTFAASGVLTPALSRRLASARLLAASTTILATMSNAAPKFRSINATMTLTPSISLLSGKGKVLNAATTLVPTLKKVVGKSMSASLNFIPNMQRKVTKPVDLVITLTPVMQNQSRLARRFDSVAVLQVALQKGAGRKVFLSVPVPLIAAMTSGRVNRVILSASAFFTALLDKVSAKARKADKTLFSTSLPDAELLGVQSTNVPAELDTVTDEEISELLSANTEKSELTSAGEEAPSLRSVT